MHLRHRLSPVAALCVALVHAGAQQTPETLAAFLRDHIALTREQIVAMERGEAIVKVMPSTNDRDVAVFGIITVDVPRGAFIAGVKDFRTSLAAPTRPQFGIFSAPPMAADLLRLTVSKEEAADLADCRPGNCAMKLPIEDIRTLHDRMHWSSPNVSAEVTAYARQRFLEYVVDYGKRGDAAMAIFADRGNVSARAAFADLLGDSPYVFQRVPSVARYLTAYPAAKLADATEVFYWSQDDLPRLRPVISITHEIVVTPPELSTTTIVAAKQIYANHYFEAGLDLTAVTDRTVGGRAGSYLLTLRRYRFDKLPGGILNIKGRATEALRDQLTEDLKRSKLSAEKRR